MNVTQSGALRSGACLLALSFLVGGCGGGSGGGSTATPNEESETPTAEIQGVATPSSVTVVTATNAD
jgi:hypothetical protein